MVFILKITTYQDNTMTKLHKLEVIKIEYGKGYILLITSKSKLLAPKYRYNLCFVGNGCMTTLTTISNMSAFLINFNR